MLSIVGTYQNGHLKLDKDHLTIKPVKVIVTFLEEVQNESETGLNLSDFSLPAAKKILKISRAHLLTPSSMKGVLNYENLFGHF